MILDWRNQLVLWALVSLLTFVTAAPVHEEPLDPKNAESPLPLSNNLENDSPSSISSQHLVPIAHEENQGVQQPNKPKEDQYDYEIANGYLPDISNDQLKAMGMVMLEGASKADLKSIQNFIAKKIIEEGVAVNANASKPTIPALTNLLSNQNGSDGPVAETRPKEDIRITEEKGEEKNKPLTSLETGVGIGNPDCNYPGCLEQLSLPPLEVLASKDPVWFRGEEADFENGVNYEAFHAQPQPEMNISAAEEYDPEPFQNAKFNAYDYPQYPESKVSGYIQKWLPHGDRISDRVVPVMESQKPAPPAPSPPQDTPDENFSSYYQQDEDGVVPIISTGHRYSDKFDSVQSKISPNIPFITPYIGGRSNMVHSDSPKLAETHENESPAAYHQSVHIDFASPPPFPVHPPAFPVQPPPPPAPVKSNSKHVNIGTWINSRDPLPDQDSNSFNDNYDHDSEPTLKRAHDLMLAFKPHLSIQNQPENFDFDNPSGVEEVQSNEKNNFDKNDAEQKVPFDALPGLAIDGSVDSDDDYNEALRRYFSNDQNQKDGNPGNGALFWSED